MPHFKIRQRESDFQNSRITYPANEMKRLDHSDADEFDKFLNSGDGRTEIADKSYDFDRAIIDALVMSREARECLLFFKDSFEESEENIHETMDLILIDHLNRLSEQRKEAIKEARNLSLWGDLAFDEPEDSFSNSDPLGEARVVFPPSSISDDNDELTGFY